jgi:predicted DNA-binding transcriptional regulator YafY
MARGDQLARQWKIIQALISSGRGTTAAQLAEEVECAQRTVYRDLEALQAAGFPVYNDRDEDGRSLWQLSDAVKKQTPLPLNMSELMALYFCSDMLKTLPDTIFHDSLESLFKKIKATLPPASLHYLQHIQKTITVGNKQYKSYAHSRDAIDSINKAAIQWRSIQFMYYSMSGRKEAKRTVDPYRIWFFKGSFYLVGFCHRRNEVRIFSVDRIKKLSLTEKRFTVREDFDFDAFTQSGFGVAGGVPETVRVEFDENVARYIEDKVWHASQKVRRGGNGSVVFEARVALTPELKSWILNWGSHARVLEPEALREDIRSAAEKIAALY